MYVLVREREEKKRRERKRREEREKREREKRERARERSSVTTSILADGCIMNIISGGVSSGVSPL